MATAHDLARRHHQIQERLARATARAAMAEWSGVDRDAIAEDWSSRVSRILVLVSGAQRAAAARSNDYITDTLDAQGFDVTPLGEVDPSAFSGVASDGRPLASLLFRPAVAALRMLRRGRPVSDAIRTARAATGVIVRTQVEDAGRVADGVAVAVRPSVGYTRYVNPPACSRCILLAGRFYRYNTGFLRHPMCDCVHVPTRNESAAESEGLIWDPRGYFDSLSREDQDRVFTKSGAQAIRDGADIGQVVNARRGLSRAAGRRTTTEGTTRFGIAGRQLPSNTPRLMPESIYELARDREDAVRLLRRFGYIL